MREILEDRIEELHTAIKKLEWNDSYHAKVNIEIMLKSIESAKSIWSIL